MQQYQPLVLKYRPQNLNDLVGQEYVVRILSNAITQDRIANAYLFIGPRGTGKTSTARILAKSLNCAKGPTVTPCEQCPSCAEVRQGTSPAVLEIDAASNNSVDDARVLIERAPLVAQGGRFKLYIIDECHMLTKEAFNALLKTLEEPPAKVIFVLATTEEHKVPFTIVSRCQRLIFRLASQSTLVDHLRKVADAESISLGVGVLDLIARRCGGGLRDALGLLDQASLLSAPQASVSSEDLLLLLGGLKEDILFALSKHILAGEGEEALKVANQLITEGIEPYLIVAELAKHFLNCAKASCLLKSGKQNPSLSEQIISGTDAYREGLIKLVEKENRSNLVAMAEALDKLEQSLKRSSQPLLIFEIGLLSLCHRLDDSEIKTLENRIGKLEREVFATSEAPQVHVSRVEPTHETTPGKQAKSDTELIKPLEPAPPPSDALTASSKVSSEIPEKHKVEEPVAPAPVVEIAATISQHSQLELDELWSSLLEELQRRHIPTYSLVSTHASPISLNQEDLIIGVQLENFQKMIENKADYIRGALEAVTGRSLSVKVRVLPSEPKQPSVVKRAAVASPSRRLATDQQKQPLEESSEPTSVSRAFKPTSHLNNETGEDESADSPASAALPRRLKSSQMVEEAYKLFEGPGSRFITASQ